MTEHRGETVRLIDLTTDLTRDGITIDGHTFDDCDINGPTLVMVADGNTVNFCAIDEIPDMVILELDPAKHPNGIVGVVAIRNCTFVNCRFKLVAFTGTPATLAEMRKALAGPSPN